MQRHTYGRGFAVEGASGPWLRRNGWPGRERPFGLIGFLGWMMRTPFGVPVAQEFAPIAHARRRWNAAFVSELSPPDGDASVFATAVKR